VGVAELPTGTVTFLFSDIEGSTRLWDEHPDGMRVSLAQHDEVLRASIESHGGSVVKQRGDGFHAAFGTADDAVVAAVAAQVALADSAWGETGPLLVRIGLHTGTAEFRDGDYYGSVLNRGARLEAAAQGGQIVCSQATADLAREALPSGFEFVDLGEHRLRDLSRSERVFQVSAPGLVAAFSPLRSVDVFPSNLPAQLSSFVGREDSVIDIAQLLREKRLVSLTGVGGVGKTRLALQVAAEVLPRFRDGAWLCELAAVRDPAEVNAAVAGVFQVTARAGLSLEESLVAFLADQELLLVLDNCEHVLRPVASLVTTLEAACPMVRVLATSREGLSVRGEQIWAVPSLELPHDTNDAEAIAACEAVRLFVDRAQGVKASFAIDATNAADVREIVSSLDGVPLAIELAAARVTAMNPGELARRLDRRFRLLTGGDRVAIERHQTLRATIDWSYDLLTEPEQRLLDRLCVFSGGCTLEAIEHVCSGDPLEPDDVFELLANLVARHLVVADDTGPDTRYRLLETIRQYAAERLAEVGDVASLRRCHCDYFTEFAGIVKQQIEGPGQIEWAVRLARDRDNLQAAMAYALGADDVHRAMAILTQFPFLGLQVDDIVILDADAVLEMPGAMEHPLCAVAFLSAAWIAALRGESTRALELCTLAEVAGERFGPVPGWSLGMSLSGVRGYIALFTSAPEQALGYWHDAYRAAIAEGFYANAAIELGLISGVESWMDPPAAQDHATEGLTLARRSGAPSAILSNLFSVAFASASTDPSRSKDALNDALDMAAKLGHARPLEYAYAVFAAARLRDWPTAVWCARRALDHQLRSGGVGLPMIAGVLNLGARGLAPTQPEPAAVLQGTVRWVAERLAAGVATDAATQETAPNGAASFVLEARRDATQIIIETLGASRLHELRAQGAAMNEDQTYRYARRHIDQYLATLDTTHPT
jgi:predicted ATPase/class 3 adenylate cyclase